MTFSDGVLSGTPAPGSGGVYPLTFTASNGVAPDATQSFTLTVDEAPAITSAGTATFSDGQAGSLTVTTTGFPAPALTGTGSLPAGVTFTDNGNGTATIGGTPGALDSGPYPITLTASNAVAPDATETLTLTVDQAPALTAKTGTTFISGQPGTFTVTTSGFPAPALTETGSLPAGVTFTDNGKGTATLAGTPTSTGTFPITITATNQIGQPITETFTLTVVARLAITGTLPSGTVGAAYRARLVATGGTPPYAWSLTAHSSLPAGLSLSVAGVISGTPTTAGTTSFTVQVGDPARATLSITIAPAATTATVTANLAPTTATPTTAATTLAATGAEPKPMVAGAAGLLLLGGLLVTAARRRRKLLHGQK